MLWHKRVAWIRVRSRFNLPVLGFHWISEKSMKFKKLRPPVYLSYGGLKERHRLFNY